ncbi:DUF4360 domain-containing protein [Streptomyces sp. NPDC012888]|uniref:DUF4360 domain-containing protein n=1 Tax=Streptomyces sp. NPDC012888 TaxID=3364855 RepID=UPI0036B5602A
MIRTPRILAAVLGVTAAALAATAPAPVAGAAAPPGPGPAAGVTIDVVSVNGSGCRPGSAAVDVSPDNTAFTVTYSEYLAQAGKGAKPTEFRRNCQIGLRVDVPKGHTYAVAKADYRGFANLAEGAVGTQKAGYYFQGTSETTGRSHDFHGPLRDNWQVTDTTALTDLAWLPCGQRRDFNINTELRVDAGGSDTATTTSFMTMDSTDGSVNARYHLSWKKCPAR